MTPQYLRVKNWEKFQHYKNRRPVWIKYHVELLNDYELTSLDYVTQLLYDRLLLVAALTDNSVPFDIGYISRNVAIDHKLVAVGVEKLRVAGFIVTSERKRSASKSIAKRSALACLETEAEKRQRNKDPKDLGEVMDLLPVLSGVPTEQPHHLGAGRDEAFALLLSRVVGGDNATPKVLWGLCKKLPSERIEGVAAKFSRRFVKPGIAVNALKEAVADYDRAIRMEAAS